MNHELEQIRTTGFARLPISEGLQILLDATVESAFSFFQLTDQDKLASVLPEDCGYRPVGVEYSQSPERPDAIESFTASIRTRSFASALEHPLALQLHGLMIRAIEGLEPLAERLVCNIASDISDRYDMDSDKIRGTLRRWSCLQLNYSRPARSSREFINDVHEDGHLLTLLRATVPGLEVLLPDSNVLPICTTRHELLVMPGKAMWLLSGGRIQPLYHRVRRHCSIPERISLLFFADIDPRHCEPWVDNAISSSEDVRAHVISNGSRFGLRGFRTE